MLFLKRLYCFLPNKDLSFRKNFVPNVKSNLKRTFILPALNKHLTGGCKQIVNYGMLQRKLDYLGKEDVNPGP